MISAHDLEKNSGVLAAVSVLRFLDLEGKNPELFKRIDSLVDNVNHILSDQDQKIYRKIFRYLSFLTKTLFSKVSSIPQPKFNEDTNIAPPNPCPIQFLTNLRSDSPTLVLTDIIASTLSL